MIELPASTAFQQLNSVEEGASIAALATLAQHRQPVPALTATFAASQKPLGHLTDPLITVLL